LVTALEPIVAKITDLTIAIRHALNAHPDGATFRSLFKAADSFLCAATMLAEIGDCRERYPSYRALAADAGQAPVAVQSGKSRHAKFRWACDHRLREAFNVLADSSRHHNPWAADIYQRARSRGAGHAHAAHPRPRLEPDHLASLARPRHLQPQQTYRPTTPRHHPHLTQEV
jgi:transposase